MPLNILLAEDDRNLGMIVKNELEEDGYAVDLVNDGVGAVLKSLEKTYDIFLFDMKMPKLDGIQALRIIKKGDRYLTAIAFSGDAGQDEIADVLEAGAIRYLSKPFEIEELKGFIRKQILVRENI
jgi:two-component system, NtrC family, response regulator AtoC